MSDSKNKTTRSKVLSPSQSKGITDTHYMHAFLAAVACVILVFIHGTISSSASYQDGLDSGEKLHEVIALNLSRNFLHPMKVAAEYLLAISSTSYVGEMFSISPDTVMSLYAVMFSMGVGFFLWFSFFYCDVSQHLQLRTMTLVEQLASMWTVFYCESARVAHYHASDYDVSKSPNVEVISRSALSLLNQQLGEKSATLDKSEPVHLAFFSTLLSLRHTVKKHVLLNAPFDGKESNRDLSSVVSSRPWYGKLFSFGLGTPTIQVPLRKAANHKVFPSTPAIGLFYPKTNPSSPVVSFHGLYPKVKLGVGHEQTPDHHHGHGHGHEEGFDLPCSTGTEIVFDNVDDEIMNMQKSYEDLAKQAVKEGKKPAKAFRLETQPGDHARGPVVVLECPFLTKSDLSCLASPIRVALFGNNILKTLYRHVFEMAMSGIHVFVTQNDAIEDTHENDTPFPNPFLMEVEQHVRKHYLWNKSSGAFKPKALDFYSIDYICAQKLVHNRDQKRFTKSTFGALVSKNIDLDADNLSEVFFTFVTKPHFAK